MLTVKVKSHLFVIGIFFSSLTFAQSIRGTLIDSVSRQPIAFANITLEDGRTGTSSDIEGNYSLPVPANYSGQVYLSHVSYQRRIVSLPFLKEHAFISLLPSATILREVAVTAAKGENPAFRIIRQAIDHKKDNDPVNLKSYQYISYNKFLVTMSEPSKRSDSIINALKNRPDTVKLKKSQKEILSFDSIARTTHFFLSESITEKQVINPDKEKEKLLALQVSGFKSPIFTNVATDYQPFSFYKDDISLLMKDFINPISKGTFSRYDFILADTSYYNSDTVFTIRYKPKAGKFFNGLKGSISICTDGFAIKNVIATSADTLALTGIRIQQNYEKIDGHWFPVQLNTDLDFRNTKVAGRHGIAQHRSFFKEIKINHELKRSTFGDIKVDLAVPKDAENKLILEKYRNFTLDRKEARTYTLLDSALRKVRSLDKILEMFVMQVVPIGPIELDISKMSRINRYETYRLGAGIYTSNRFSKWLRLGGYAGYGFRDQQWKYGGETKFNFNLNKDFFLRFAYAKDIIETGSLNVSHDGQLLSSENFRTWVSSRYDRIEFYKGEIGYRLFPDVHTTVFVSRNEITPTYNYQFQLNNELLSRFLIVETGLTFRYVRDESYMSLRGKKIFIGQRFPVISFSVVQAAPMFDAMNFNYTRFDFTAKLMRNHRYGGKTRLFLSAGWLEGLAPYGKLYNGRGASLTYYLVDDYFQTMGLYEFSASKYASVFLQHNFGNVLLNKKFSKPELVLYHNIGIGQLENQQAHIGFDLQAFDKGFTEAGLGLNNIIRGNYANVAYWGIGGGAFYRYGNYQFPNSENNLFWKLSFSIGF